MPACPHGVAGQFGAVAAGLVLILSRCARTVLGVTKSVSAILVLLTPPASSAMIFRSRGDSGSAGLSADAASWNGDGGRGLRDGLGLRHPPLLVLVA